MLGMPDMSGRLLLMSGRELRPCRTFCPAGFNTHRMSNNETKNDHCYLPFINWENCLTGVQNVRQSAEGLPDTLSGTPKIFFAITENEAKNVPNPDPEAKKWPKSRPRRPNLGQNWPKFWIGPIILLLLRLPQFLFLFLIPGRVGFWPLFKKKQTRYGNKTASFSIVFPLIELQV